MERKSREPEIRNWNSSIGIPFLAALQFLTIAPPLIRRPFTMTELGAAVGHFPLVGVLLGLVLVGLRAGLRIILPGNVTAALVLAVWIILTGALHLDGFLDTCDGLFGGATAEDRLRILRDEQVGAFAVAGGVALLLVKYAALAALPDYTLALLVAPTLGRWAMSLAVIAFPYGRSQGLGRALKDHAGRRELIVATVIALITVGIASGWLGLAAAALVAATTWVLARFALSRLPGLTGDIYGAICELTEVLVLLVVVVGSYS